MRCFLFAVCACGRLAFDAPTSFGFYVFVKKLCIIVIIQLLSCFDGPLCQHKYTLFIDINFAVGAARVVDVAGRVTAGTTIYCFCFTYLKKILTCNGLVFSFFEGAPYVLNNARTFGDWLPCKQTKARLCTLNRNLIASRRKLTFFLFCWCRHKNHLTTKPPHPKRVWWFCAFVVAEPFILPYLRS